MPINFLNFYKEHYILGEVKCQDIFLQAHNKKYLDIASPFLYNTSMKKYKRKPWTLDERRTLSEHYYRINIEDLLYLLPDRSEQAIRNQVAYLRKRGYRFSK
jgi:hypothetical protein